MDTDDLEAIVQEIPDEAYYVANLGDKDLADDEGYEPGELPEVEKAESVDENRFNDHLRYTLYWQKEAEKIEAEYKKAKGRLELRFKSMQDSMEKRMRFHRSMLEAFLRRNTQSSFKSLYGTVSITRGRTSLEIVDENAAIEAAESDHPECLEISIRKSVVLDILKKTGEILPGVEMIQGDDYITIRASKTLKHLFGG